MSCRSGALAAAAGVEQRQRARGGRFFGWMLVLVTGTLLFSASGQRIVSDARAGLDPAAISLTVSPGTLDVGPYFPMADPLIVPVTNNTGTSTTLTSITVTPQNDPYTISGMSSCVVGLTLPPGASCEVRMFGVPP